MLFKALQVIACTVFVLAFASSASTRPIGAAGHPLGLAGVQTIVPISDRLPNFNIEGLCKATAADDAAMGLTLAQSVENCMRDETAAKQQLAAIWEQNAGAARNSCEGEAAAGPSESQSYVDLLTCMQMAGVANDASLAMNLRGGGKNRNKK